MPAVPNRPDATDRRAARASPSRMGQLMSDDLILTTLRAWSSRFSPSETSASTRLKPSNRGLQGFEVRFPRSYPSKEVMPESLPSSVASTLQRSPQVMQALPTFQN